MLPLVSLSINIYLFYSKLTGKGLTLTTLIFKMLCFCDSRLQNHPLVNNVEWSALDDTTVYSYFNYVSQFTMETFCFADGRCLFKQPRSVIYHWNEYNEISKKCRCVRPFVTLAKKPIYSHIMIRISGERAWHPLQENEAIFLKNYLSKILNQIFEKFWTWIICLLLHY